MGCAWTRRGLKVSHLPFSLDFLIIFSAGQLFLPRISIFYGFFFNCNEFSLSSFCLIRVTSFYSFHINIFLDPAAIIRARLCEGSLFFEISALLILSPEEAKCRLAFVPENFVLFLFLGRSRSKFRQTLAPFSTLYPSFPRTQNRQAVIDSTKLQKNCCICGSHASHHFYHNFNALPTVVRITRIFKLNM